MLRIISGIMRRRQLEIPPAHLTRPTSDRARGAVFNILEHGLNMGYEKKRVLDLFAGSGAMGFEALSRGAEHATFIEQTPEALRVLKHNIQTLKCEDKTCVLKDNVLDLKKNASSPFDLVFMDPPYALTLPSYFLLRLYELGWIHERSLICYEYDAVLSIPTMDAFIILEERTYGAAKFIFWEKTI